MVISLIYILSFLFTILFVRLYYPTRSTATNKTPPSPPKLPIIGNLHQIGPLFYRSLFSLAQSYGDDLMLLHMGSVPTLVVSSSTSAREIMQTHDLKFASKAPLYLNKKLFYDSKEIATAPYGEYWKQAKKIIVVNFLGIKKLQTYNEVMDQEIDITISKIEKYLICNKAVNLGDLFVEHVNDVACRITFGRKYDDGEIGKKLKKTMKEFSEVFSHFYIVDFIPQLEWIDRINGANNKVETVAKDIDEFLEFTTEERLANHHELGEGVEPVIDALLRIQKDDVLRFSFDRNVLKALLMDSYFGGIETTSTLLEWVMAELLAHPSTLNKLQEEVRTIVNGKKQITDDDVAHMKFLKAVIMETSRLHPPIVILFPQVAMQDANVMGFDIAKGTTVYINIWAIGRDPKVWERPNEFVPERFVGGSISFVTHNFQLLLFGAGRRSCPGKDFVTTVVEKLLANLICKFDWAVKEEDMDMNETIGFAVHKKIPLSAFATPYSS